MELSSSSGHLQLTIIVFSSEQSLKRPTPSSLNAIKLCMGDIPFACINQTHVRKDGFSIANKTLGQKTWVHLMLSHVFRSTCVFPMSIKCLRRTWIFDKAIKYPSHVYRFLRNDNSIGSKRHIHVYTRNIKNVSVLIMKGSALFFMRLNVASRWGQRKIS